ncbi:hypothetical protein AAKU67_000940 [Oxalobacteraceae bacterium GrIS 2.11]
MSSNSVIRAFYSQNTNLLISAPPTINQANRIKANISSANQDHAVAMQLEQLDPDKQCQHKRAAQHQYVAGNARQSDAYNENTNISGLKLGSSTTIGIYLLPNILGRYSP